MIWVETAGKPAQAELDATAVDLLTGEALKGRVELKPYEVRVLRYAEAQA